MCIWFQCKNAVSLTDDQLIMFCIMKAMYSDDIWSNKVIFIQKICYIVLHVQCFDEFIMTVDKFFNLESYLMMYIFNTIIHLLLRWH